MRPDMLNLNGLYFGPTSRLKSFGSTSKGAKAVLRLEVEITDFSDLGYLLGQLAAIEGEQNKPAKKQPVKKQLALPDYSGDGQ